MSEIPIGATTTTRIRFVQECSVGAQDEHFATTDVTVSAREWDVADAEERERAFREIVGEDPDHWWSKHAQWFIDERRNAAGLCIYRFKTPANLRDWEEKTGVAA